MSWIREDTDAERLKAFLELIADGFDDPVQLAKDALAGNEPPLRAAVVMVRGPERSSGIYIADVE